MVGREVRGAHVRLAKRRSRADPWGSDHPRHLIEEAIGEHQSIGPRLVEFDGTYVRGLHRSIASSAGLRR